MIRVIFFGTPDFAKDILEALIADPSIDVVCAVTQPDKPSGRGQLLRAAPVKELCNKNKIPVLQPGKLSKETDTFLESLKPFGDIDCGIVVAFGQILPGKILSFPKCGCINVHASLLPRWRGAAPIHRAIMAGDEETGIALMQMDEGLDTGPVFISESIVIEKDDTTGIVHDKLSNLAGKLLRRTLPKIIAKELMPEPQSDAGVTYAKKITNEEAKIPWHYPAMEVHNHIRGLSPYPGAFCMAQNARLKVFLSEVVRSDGVQSEDAGKVSRISPHELRVLCGAGEIRLLDVQLEGRKRMPVEEFLKSNYLSEGSVLE